MTSGHYHEILEYIRNLIDGTCWQNHVFAVGGCCRDEILGCEIKDVDLAVSLPGGGIDLAMWIYDRGLTAKKPVTFPTFGTAMLRLTQFPDDEIEIVQTRAEKYTDKTRRDPTTVFGSIEADCKRRDLTINALYYDISQGEMLDILGCSIDDIHNHIIRTPDDPDSTFDDDPVRILRAVRLAARYGWEIDPSTYQGMKSNVHRLEIVRKERMQAEFDKMLNGSNPAKAMDMLRRIGAMHYVMPELVPMFDIEQNDNHIGTVWQHTLAVLEKMPQIPVMRMAALLHEMGKTIGSNVGRDGKIHFTGHEHRGLGLINAALRRLRYESQFIDKVIFLIVNHKAAKCWGPKAEKMTLEELRKLQFKCSSRDRFDRLLTLIDADNKSFAPGHGMPLQVEFIRNASAELDQQRTSMFSVRLPIAQAKIRKVAGLGPDDDLKPYTSYILKLLFANPKMPKDKIIHCLEKEACKIKARAKRTKNSNKR